MTWPQAALYAAGVLAYLEASLLINRKMVDRWESMFRLTKVALLLIGPPLLVLLVLVVLVYHLLASKDR